MNIQIVNMVIYVLVIAVILYCFFVKDKDDRKWVVYVKNHLFMLVFVLVINTISFALSMKGKKPEIYIERETVDGSEEEYSFKADIMGDSLPFKLKVPPKMLKPKEVQALMEEAFSYIDDNLKGDNVSLDKVEKPLDIELDSTKYPFDLEVVPKDYSLVGDDGELRNQREQLEAEGYTAQDMVTGILTEVKIVMSYEGVTKEKTYSIKIFPKEEDDKEKLLSEIEHFYKRKEQESVYEDGFLLPTNYKGIDIISLDSNGISPDGILVIGIIIVVLLIIREAENKKTEEKKRNKELLRAYPWFINEMVLMLGAGMQVRNIFSLLIDKYERPDYREALINELKRSKQDFDIGLSEGKIYYELGRRLKLPCYIKLLAMLEQNVTKGSRGLMTVLEQEERSALEERINLAKKQGEEAGTKILGPMILLLIIVMLMIMVPAFMSFA